MAQAAQHWDGVYANRAGNQLSWFQANPATSLRLLQAWAPSSAPLVDVGSGASTLVDSLLDAGWADVTLLDVSTEVLDKVRDRLGDRAGRVRLIRADVRLWDPERTYEAWHDRALFHFLIDPADRERYVEVATRALEPGGVIVLAAFANDGPTECSGLPTARYDPGGLVAAFAPAFVLEHAEREEHVTPAGLVQPFSWVVLRRQP